AQEHADETRPLQVSTAVKRVLDACVVDLLAATFQRIEESGVSSPADVQAQPRLLVGYSDEFGRRQRDLARLLHERFYRHPRLVRMGRKAHRFLTEIFAAYLRDPATLDKP